MSGRYALVGMSFGTTQGRIEMTTEVQAVFVVTIKGHIDGPFSEWAQGIQKKLGREVELSFGQAGSVAVLSPNYSHTMEVSQGTGNHVHRLSRGYVDADGHPILIGEQVKDPRWDHGSGGVL